MADLFLRLKKRLKGPIFGDLPPELAQCEDACRKGKCSHGEWLTCENRITRENQEIAARSKRA